MDDVVLKYSARVCLRVAHHGLPGQKTPQLAVDSTAVAPDWFPSVQVTWLICKFVNLFIRSCLQNRIQWHPPRCNFYFAVAFENDSAQAGRCREQRWWWPSWGGQWRSDSNSSQKLPPPFQFRPGGNDNCHYLVSVYTNRLGRTLTSYF